MGETKNLASAKPDVAADLYQTLTQWREDVGAQMLTDNPNFDPVKQAEVGRKKKR